MDAAVDEADAAVGSLGHLLAVGDEDDRSFFPAGEGGEEVDDGGAGGGVKISGGLVGEEDGRAVNKGASECSALHLTAGELVGAMMHAVGQSNGFEEVAGPGFANPIDPTGKEEGKENVFLDGEGGEKVKKLKNESDPELAEGSELVVVEGMERMALEVDLTGGGRVEGSEDVEQGAFSAAAGSGNRDDLSREDF